MPVMIPMHSTQISMIFTIVGMTTYLLPQRPQTSSQLLPYIL